MNEVDLGYDALVGIASISVAATVLAMLVVRRWSDQDGVAGTKRRRMPTSLSCGSSWMTQRRYCGLSEHWWWTNSAL